MRFEPGPSATLAPADQFVEVPNVRLAPENCLARPPENGCNVVLPVTFRFGTWMTPPLQLKLPVVTEAVPTKTPFSTVSDDRFTGAPVFNVAPVATELPVNDRLPTGPN